MISFILIYKRIKIIYIKTNQEIRGKHEKNYNSLGSFVFFCRGGCSGKKDRCVAFKNLMQKQDINYLSEGIAATITAKLGRYERNIGC